MMVTPGLGGPCEFFERAGCGKLLLLSFSNAARAVTAKGAFKLLGILCRMKPLPRNPMPPPNLGHLRSLAIERVKKRLMQASFPRLQMTLIVAFTGGVGLLSSLVMLPLGVETMAIRYPLALAVAYLFFLFLMWLWLRTKAQDYLDLPDWTHALPGPRTSTRLPDFKSGGGGEFTGGGATGSFNGDATSLPSDASSPLGVVGDSLGAVAEADELPSRSWPSPWSSARSSGWRSHVSILSTLPPFFLQRCWSTVRFPTPLSAICAGNRLSIGCQAPCGVPRCPLLQRPCSWLQSVRP